MSKTIGIVEILISFIFIGVGLYSFIGIFTCPVGTPDCEGWAILGAFISIPPGLLTLGCAIWFIKTENWLSHTLLVPAVSWVIYWYFYA